MPAAVVGKDSARKEVDVAPHAVVGLVLQARDTEKFRRVLGTQWSSMGRNNYVTKFAWRRLPLP